MYDQLLCTFVWGFKSNNIKYCLQASWAEPSEMNFIFDSIFFNHLLVGISRRSIGTVFQPQYIIELESLQKLLHFPEEVALSLLETENSIFYQIPPIDYLRQATLESSGASSPRHSVHSLARRFNEVNFSVILIIQRNGFHEWRKTYIQLFSDFLIQSSLYVL